MDKNCIRCGCKFEYYGSGTCYSCQCKEFQEGKRDKYGNSLFTEISNKRLDELLKIEAKYKKFNCRMKKD